MANFGFFCKSFAQDFHHLSNLINSFLDNNNDGISLIISVPKSDLTHFQDRFGTSDLIGLVSDEEIYSNLSNLPGWYHQQLVKFYSYKAVNFESYVVLDSDTYFTRNFSAKDFYVEGEINLYASTTRTVFRAKENELLDYVMNSSNYFNHKSIFDAKKIQPFEKLSSYSVYAKSSLSDIENILGSPISRSNIPYEIFNCHKWLYYQPGQIFSRDVLIDFKNFLNNLNFTFEDLLRISPWEYNWYGEFCLWNYYDKLITRVSPVLHFSNDNDVILFRSSFADKFDLYFEKFPLVAMAARHSNFIRI